MDNQGRSNKQMENNYKITSIGFIGIVLIITYLVIFN